MRAWPAPRGRGQREQRESSPRVGEGGLGPWWSRRDLVGLEDVAEGPGPTPALCPQHQIVQYLRDMFDLDNVRYTSVPALADDILQLSRRRSEILLGYLGTPVTSSIGLNGALPRENGPLAELQ